MPPGRPWSGYYMHTKKVYDEETPAPLWSYLTISLVVGYLNYDIGQARDDH